MKKAVVITTWINYILSILLWILGILVLLFNILGMWTEWHLAGFGYYFFFIHPMIASGLAILFATMNKEAAVRKKYILHNSIVLGISAVMTVLSLFVFSKWFW